MTTSNFANFADLTCDQFADTLADFLEREVSEPTRAAMEAHALGCTVCGPLLADVRKLRIDAANLGDLEPARDLWAGIAGRIETPVVSIGTRDSAGTGESGRGARWKRRVSAGLAAAGLVAITATITHELTKRSVANTQTAAVDPVVATPSTEPGHPAPVGSPSLAPAVAGTRQVPSPAASEARVPAPASRRLVSNTQSSIDDTYRSEIAKLFIILNQRRGGLDSTTVAVIDKNLGIIDEAIENCRAALKKDPRSRFLTESLNDALDTKVQLLRTAAALPTRM